MPCTLSKIYPFGILMTLIVDGESAEPPLIPENHKQKTNDFIRLTQCDSRIKPFAIWLAIFCCILAYLGLIVVGYSTIHNSFKPGFEVYGRVLGIFAIVWGTPNITWIIINLVQAVLDSNGRATKKFKQHVLENDFPKLWRLEYSNDFYNLLFADYHSFLYSVTPIEITISRTKMQELIQALKNNRQFNDSIDPDSQDADNVAYRVISNLYHLNDGTDLLFALEEARESPGISRQFEEIHPLLVKEKRYASKLK
jgi:hypothetical protein